MVSKLPWWQQQSFSPGILPPELSYADLQVMCGDYLVLRRAVARKGVELYSAKVRCCYSSHAHARILD